MICVNYMYFGFRELSPSHLVISSGQWVDIRRAMEHGWITLLVLSIAACITQAAHTYKSGPFEIVYDPEKTPTLQIIRDEKTVWFTSRSNQTFVTAASVDEHVTQDGGNFVFTPKIAEECTKMRVTGNGSHSSSQGYDEVYFVGELCEVTFELTFQAVDISDGENTVTHLLFYLSLLNASQYNQLRLTYGCERDEQFYGFGAQYSRFNMKGQRLPLFLSEQGVGRGVEPLTWLLDIFSPGAGIFN